MLIETVGSYFVRCAYMKEKIKNEYILMVGSYKLEEEDIFDVTNNKGGFFQHNIFFEKSFKN